MLASVLLSTSFLAQMFGLDGRVALVTGGGTGIGRALSEGLACAGATVVISGRRQDRLTAAAEEINAKAGRTACFTVQHDVSDLKSAQALIDKAASATGTPVTILVNNAGLNVRKPAEALTEEDWDVTLDTMLKAPFFLARAAAPGMSVETYGRIINIASLQSKMAFPNSLPYAAAKSGLEGVTRGIAEAYSARHGYHGITCNAVAPGYVSTELTAPVFADAPRADALAARTLAGRNSVPDDLVGAVVFLASPASAYVTAQTMYVDGGFTALGQ